MNGAEWLNIDSGRGAGEGGRASFWQRQFQQEPTRGQIIFDVFLGIVLPILCFIFDPIIFRGNFFGGAALFGRIQLPVYLMAFIEISALTIWLCAGKRLGRRSVALGGFLYAGALISFLIGVVLFPLSVIGIALAGLGLLGFTPFFTALVYWRNGQRAFNLSPDEASAGRKFAALALALVFVLGLPVMAHLKISGITEESIQKILTDNEMEAEAAAEKLRFIGYLNPSEMDKIVWIYHDERDEVRRERLARMYFRITGMDIEIRRTFLLD